MVRPLEKILNTTDIFRRVEDKTVPRCEDAKGRFTLRDWRNICSRSSVGRLSSRDSLNLTGRITAISGDTMLGVMIIRNKRTEGKAGVGGS